jgi:short subunit dehydrogenase-like uncharacterized protein
MSEIWILGATGRSGRIVAANLAARGLAVVLVGRDRARLDEIAKGVAGSRVVVATSIVDTVTELTKATPSVVVNTIGPFGQTALAVVRACPRGTHYVDISNEISSFLALAAFHNEAVAAGKCLVSGAGWGVLGTESVLIKTCKDRPAPEKVRVDMIPFVKDDGSALGPTVAASIVDGLPAGGRRYKRGQLVRAAFGCDPERFTLPDGTAVATAGAPTGELFAAQRASGAPFVVAAATMAPGTVIGRTLFRVLGFFMRSRTLRRIAIGRMANLRGAFEGGSSTNSWARAKVQWHDGTKREGWLRAGDSTTFTTNVMTEVATRLARGEGRPGSWTPGVLFGPELAEVAGATFLDGTAK